MIAAFVGIIPSLIRHIKKGDPDEKECIAFYLSIWSAFDILFSILSGIFAKYLNYKACLIVVGISGMIATAISVYFYYLHTVNLWWIFLSLAWAIADATFNYYVVAICASAFKDKTGPLTIFLTFRCITVFFLLILLNLYFI